MKKLSFIAANLLALAAYCQSVTTLTFDTDADITSNFYIPEGGVPVYTENGALKIAGNNSRTLIYDTTPDGTPSNIFSGDFVLSFKFKSNTAQLIPPTGNDDTQKISVWASFFPQSAPRLNSPRIRLNLAEMYQDETYFETGTSMNNSTATATSTPIEAVNFLRELSPAYNGDTWYTFKAIVLQQGGGTVKCHFTVSDGDYELINNTYTFTGLTTTTGEIAIGGSSNDLLKGLYIDDFQVSTVIPAFTEHVYLKSTAAGNAFMYLPPNINSVTGILVLAPGSGANFFYVLQTDYHRKFAQAHNVALLSFDNSITAPNSILTAISDFATQTGHAELTSAPYMFYGFSLGSITTNSFVNAYPDRVIAYASDGYYTPVQYNTNTQSIPGIFFNGVTDIVSITTFLDDLKTKRGSNALMGGLVKENYGHLEMGMFNVYLPFFEQALNERDLCNTGILAPLDQIKGWLMNNTLDSIGFYASGNIGVPIAPVHPYESYSGDKSQASWFMNKDVAYVASSFVTFFKQIALTQPYHGTEGESRTIPVRISTKLNHWTRIELYDQSVLIQTIYPGQPLQFTYNNIGKGAHAMIAVAIQDNKKYASFPVSLIMSSSSIAGISMPSVFDNGITKPCTGPQSYAVKKSCGLTYTWSVSGTGNSITTSNENTATINWKSSGTVSVVASSGSLSSQPRLLFVNTDLESDAFSVQNPKMEQRICYISVDSVSQKNELHFIKPSAQYVADSKKFDIWRESGTPNVFDSVTTIYDVSVPFIDQSSNTSSKADKYYIKLIDRCGYSHIGDTAQSLHLYASDLLSGNTATFSWGNDYLNFDAIYTLYRSANGLKSKIYTDTDFLLNSKDTLPNSTNNIYYFIEVSGLTGCDSSDLSLNYKLRSNQILFNPTIDAIQQFNISNNLNVTPNPTSGIIKAVSATERINYAAVLDALGKIVWSEKNDTAKEMTIDLSNLSKGMYIMKLYTENGLIVNKKIVRQ